jgi:hypothetical protein
MKIPGFTAETSLFKTSRLYQSVATLAYSNRGQKVISQLSINPFPVSHGFGFFGDLGSSLCRGFCDAVYSACLEGCEGTPENPKGSTHCIICDQEHNACLQGCG